MTPEEKLLLDVADFWRIHAGLEVYAGLDAGATLERLRNHPEDGLCLIATASGSDQLFCTREAFDAIYALAERHVNSLPVPDDYSIEDVATGIRKHFARAVVEQKHDEPALVCLLERAVADASAGHIARVYHFPCVLFRSGQPPKLDMGPVVLAAADEFFRLMAEKFDRYVEHPLNPEFSKELLGDFKRYVLEAGWVASVTVPACSETSGQNRAEVAAGTAVNLLRMLIGIPHAGDIRLTQAFQSRPVQNRYATEERGMLNLIESRRTPYPLLDDKWHVQAEKLGAFWEGCAHLLRAAVQGTKSEIADRVIDAITWFGEAAFEPAPGTQIGKLVFALERLTITGGFNTHAFCVRTALLTCETNAEFERRYWDAFSAYDARSRVVHGQVSPRNSAFRQHLQLAHELTRCALFRSLAIHSNTSGTVRTVVTLDAFFERWLSSIDPTLLKKLRSEASARRKAQRKANRAAN